jgi:single-stranded DNA-binding protein
VGRLEVRRWKDGEGRDREGLRVVVDHLVSARSVRPGGGSKGSGSESGASSATHPLMEEEIPFAPEVRA